MVAGVVREDAVNTVPEFALQRAVSQFKAGQVADGSKAATARLVFDSSSGALAGVRTHDVPGRRLVFETDDARIDLQVATGAVPRSSTLAGQLSQLPRGTPLTAIVTVYRSADGAKVVRAPTNEFGEFFFEFEAAVVQVSVLPLDGRTPFDVFLYTGPPDRSSTGVPSRSSKPSNQQLSDARRKRRR
jgi:hypothetical protein